MFYLTLFKPPNVVTAHSSHCSGVRVRRTPALTLAPLSSLAGGATFMILDIGIPEIKAIPTGVRAPLSVLQAVAVGISLRALAKRVARSQCFSLARSALPGSRPFRSPPVHRP